MKILTLTDQQHADLMEYLKGQREVNHEVMEEADLEKLDDLISVVDSADPCGE